MEGLCFGVKLRQATIGAHPYIPELISKHAIHHFVGQPLGFGNVRKPTGGFFQFIDPTPFGTHPQVIIWFIRVIDSRGHHIMA